MIRPLARAAAFLLAFSQPALAQSEPRVVDRGAHSILIDIGSNTSVGYSLRVGQRTDLGVEVAFRIADEDDVYSRLVSIRPEIKRYLTSDSEIAPYVFVGGIAQWSRLELGIDRSVREFGGIIGFGLNWFPVQRVSIGGHLGFEGMLTRRDQTALTPSGEEELSGYDVGTLSSGVRMQLYF